MKINLKTPCKDCPFRAGVDLHLGQGRIEGIIESLKDDWHAFQCHKTTHKGEWSEDGDTYIPTGEESVCMGSLAYMHREGYLPVIARVALMTKKISLEDIKGSYPLLIESKGHHEPQ